jgi:hypothetical protein
VVVVSCVVETLPTGIGAIDGSDSAPSSELQAANATTASTALMTVLRPRPMTMGNGTQRRARGVFTFAARS